MIYPPGRTPSAACRPGPADGRTASGTPSPQHHGPQQPGPRHVRAHGGDTIKETFKYTIDLTYVGRGLHEELVAYIADQQGYYADEGVRCSGSSPARA
jgi:hypothetical protein